MGLSKLNSSNYCDRTEWMLIAFKGFDWKLADKWEKQEQTAKALTVRNPSVLAVFTLAHVFLSRQETFARTRRHRAPDRLFITRETRKINQRKKHVVIEL